jgi:site-specific DNA-methyltransferase (adenine-specific)
MKIIHSDCLVALKEMDENSIDSIVTDPPYGLSFMGKKWDYDVPSKEIWEACFRVLKPGGHLLSFAGTRTQHRMAVNIEDAGFEIRDMIAWVYGSGFPKSLNLKDDKKGWGTALKPAMEPITVARKPPEGTVAENVMKHGTGAINVDGCRVAHDEPIKAMKAQSGGDKVYGQSGRHEATTELKPEGRWPANLIHDGSEEVVGLFPQTGISRGGNSKQINAGTGCYNWNAGTDRAVPDGINPGYGDKGSAARFFYCAKASKADRDDGNNHPTVKPTTLMRYLCRLVTPTNGTILDPFMGSGSTGKAAILEGFNFIGIEREAEYIKIAEARIGHAEKQKAETLL